MRDKADAGEAAKPQNNTKPPGKAPRAPPSRNRGTQLVETYLSALAGSVSVVAPEAILILAACVMFAAAPFYRSERIWSSVSVLLCCSRPS